MKNNTAAAQNSETDIAIRTKRFVDEYNKFGRVSRHGLCAEIILHGEVLDVLPCLTGTEIALYWGEYGFRTVTIDITDTLEKFFMYTVQTSLARMLTTGRDAPFTQKLIDGYKIGGLRSRPPDHDLSVDEELNRVKRESTDSVYQLYVSILFLANSEGEEPVADRAKKVAKMITGLFQTVIGRTDYNQNHFAREANRMFKQLLVEQYPDIIEWLG